MPASTRRRIRGAAAIAAAAALVLSGCSGGALSSGSSGDSSTGTITIGYVTPQTGALAPFGATDKYVIAQMTKYFAAHPITTADGVKHKVEIRSADTHSDSKRASQVAQDLILKHKAKLILVSSTPDTTNPVSDQCEANHIVCISTVAPWQAWFFGRGGKDKQAFDWTYHFFWGLEDAEAVYQDIWTKAAPDAKRVGLLLPNDADGTAWADTKTGFPPFITSKGLTSDNPGAFPDGTTDFSAQIARFKQRDDEILTAIPIPPDFTTFWKQAVQQGYHPKVATVAKAILFPTSVGALGKLGNNLSTEVWWAPTYPYSSSLTGDSAQQLADTYEKATGQQWSQPLGFAEALFEVATAALTKSKSLDESDISAAMKTMKVDTVVGPLDWTSGPQPNVAKTPLAGGQWRLQPDGSYELVIVSNAGQPRIPVAGKPEPIDWSGAQ